MNQKAGPGSARFVATGDRRPLSGSDLIVEGKSIWLVQNEP